jgi:hypothetical protein
VGVGDEAPNLAGTRLAGWAETAMGRHMPRVAVAPSAGRRSGAGRPAGKQLRRAPVWIGGSGTWALGTRRQISLAVLQVHDAGGGRGRVRVPSRSVQIRLDPQVAVATRGRPARSLARRRGRPARSRFESSVLGAVRGRGWPWRLRPVGRGEAESGLGEGGGMEAGAIDPCPVTSTTSGGRNQNVPCTSSVL